MQELKKKYDELGITLNPKKTQIIPVRRFTFLKVRYSLTKTGRVVMKPCRDSVVRQRRKLKKFKRMVDRGDLTMDDVRSSYESWRGYQKHMNAHDTIRSMDKLFCKVFGVWPTRKSDRK